MKIYNGKEIFLFFFISLSFLLSLFFIWPQVRLLFVHPSENKKWVGEIIEARGATQILKKNKLQAVQRGDHFFSGDTLITGKGAQVDLRLLWRDGVEISIQEESQLSFKQQAKSLHILLDRGNFDILKSGDESSSIFVLSEGRKQSLEEFENSNLNLTSLRVWPIENAPIQNKDDDTGRSLPPTPQNEGMKNPTLLSVKSRLNKQNTFFFRCYSQYLSKNSLKEGGMRLKLVISNKGKVQLAQIKSSDFNDEDLESCVLDVTRRVLFQSFEGPELHLIFPLEFKKTPKP